MLLGKMRQILITILAQIHGIRFHHNHKHETVLGAVSQMEFVKSDISDLGFVCQRSSRANLGGMRVTRSGYSNIPFESPVQLADSLLCCLSLSARPKVVPLDDIIHWMIDVTLNAPLGAVPFCSAVSGAQIVSRPLSFRPSTQIQTATLN
jgi:hypothetical protein